MLQKLYRRDTFLSLADKSTLIQNELYENFDTHELNLQFKIVSTKWKREKHEFLGILHKIKSSEKKNLKL